MTRTSIFIATAFATLTGCAESADATDGGEIGAVGFAGITRSQPIDGMSDEPAPQDEDADREAREAAERQQDDDLNTDGADMDPGDADPTQDNEDEQGAEGDDGPQGNDEPDPEPRFATPADLPAGAWSMNVKDVHYTKGDVNMEAGRPQLAIITDVNGVPMLQGMAAILADGEALRAEQIDVSTAPAGDGRCELVTVLIADGYQTGPESFEMEVYFEDGVYGEDCEKMGWGSEKGEAVSFAASFIYLGEAAEQDEQDSEKK
jgi:hypothetical protein